MVFDNLSPQRSCAYCSCASKRGGSNYSPADNLLQYVVLQKLLREQNAYNKQLSREAADFTEASRSAKAMNA